MYTAVYKKNRGGYAAWIEEIPGVNTQGQSKTEARENLGDALHEFIAARRMLTRKEKARDASLVRERFTVV